MAYSLTRLWTSVLGNKRAVGIRVTADAASGAVDTGLSVVESVTYGPVSMNSAGIKLKINLSAASAAANGSILVSGCTSGDAFEIVCHGR